MSTCSAEGWGTATAWPRRGNPVRLQSLGFAKLVISGPSSEIKSPAVELHADYQCSIKWRALQARRLLYAEHSGSRHCPVPFAMQHTSRPAAELLISLGTSAAYAKPSGEIQRIWGMSGKEQEFPFVGLQGIAGTHYTSVSGEAKTAEPREEVSRQHREGLVQTAVQMGNRHDQPHKPCTSKRML